MFKIEAAAKLRDATYVSTTKHTMDACYIFDFKLVVVYCAFRNILGFPDISWPLLSVT